MFCETKGPGTHRLCIIPQQRHIDTRAHLAGGAVKTERWVLSEDEAGGKARPHRERAPGARQLGFKLCDFEQIISTLCASLPSPKDGAVGDNRVGSQRGPGIVPGVW